MDQMSPVGNKERNFAPLPPEPNGRNKSMDAHDQIPPNPANSRHRCTVTFVGGAFQNSPLRPNQEGPALERSPSSHMRNPRSASFIQAEGEFTMDQTSPDDNKEWSFASLPPKPNGQNKSMGVHDRIPRNLANSRHRCTITLTGGAFRNFPLRPDQEGPASERSPSSHKRNPRSASFIQVELVQNMTVVSPAWPSRN
jgi:hypothetical protein